MRYGLPGSVLALLTGTALVVAQAPPALPPSGASADLAQVSPTSPPSGASVEAVKPPAPVVAYPEPRSPYWPNPLGLMDCSNCYAPPAAPCKAHTDEQDHGTLIWASADYLLWWIKKGPESVPLVTGGSAATLGVLGSGDTTTLFGGSGIDYHEFSGVRFTTGLWFDHEHLLGIEGSGFVLEHRPENFTATSSANGGPVLARPVVNALTGNETVELVSAPGVAAGLVSVGSGSELYSWEINFLRNVYCSDKLQVDALLGFRRLNLTEDLDILQGSNLLANGTAGLVGATVVQPSSVILLDHFSTRNDYYGGQLGARAEYQRDHLFVKATAKLALGSSVDELRVAGFTQQLGPNAVPGRIPGGLLALSSNSGSTSRDQFAVVPEFGINVGYDFNHLVRVYAGYTFLYWTEVIRPGDQIARTVNPALLPTSQSFGSPSGPAQPSRIFHTSDFWAQGFNIGLELRY